MLADIQTDRRKEIMKLKRRFSVFKIMRLKLSSVLKYGTISGLKKFSFSHTKWRRVTS